MNTLIETALGGAAATQVIQGEEQFDLVVRMQEPFRQNENSIRNLLITTPDGQHLPLSQFADIHVENGASMIYREANSRYIGVQFSVDGRDLASAVGEARKRVAQSVKLPIGYKFDWGGEYQDYLSSMAQMRDDSTAYRPVNFADPIRSIWKFEVSAHYFLQRVDYPAGWRIACPPHDRDNL